MNKEILESLESQWHNAYWFSRMLISNDKYGGIGKDSKLLAKLASALRVIEVENKQSHSTLQLQKNVLKEFLREATKGRKSSIDRINLLIQDLNERIISREQMQVFIITCEAIMIPINQALKIIPSDDKEFTLIMAKAYLDAEKEAGLANVINLWDDAGVKGCLTAERTEVIKAFQVLRLYLNKEQGLTLEQSDIVLSGFVQEFERRLGQKRKSRAGGSLEDVTAFILSYFGINSAPAPEHFQADIEVDNWVKAKNGWLIGISCKRTLRERWKQVSSADASSLSKHKIKHVFHVITFDEDLSDDKLTLLGSLRHIFYLPDSSRRLKHAQNHIGLKEYVRPMSDFIKDLREEIKK